MKKNGGNKVKDVEWIDCYCGDADRCGCEPQQGGKNKETIEEEPKQYLDINTCMYWDIEIGCEKEKCICENQEPKQKRMYSEEDMINFAFNTYYYISGIMKVPFNQLSENLNHAKDNFEQFKKEDKQ